MTLTFLVFRRQNLPSKDGSGMILNWKNPLDSMGYTLTSCHCFVTYLGSYRQVEGHSIRQGHPPSL